MIWKTGGIEDKCGRDTMMAVRNSVPPRSRPDQSCKRLGKEKYYVTEL